MKINRLLSVITANAAEVDIEKEQEKVIWVETKDGKETRYTKDPGTSGWRRFNEDVFSILPIESQL